MSTTPEKRAEWWRWVRRESVPPNSAAWQDAIAELLYALEASESLVYREKAELAAKLIADARVESEREEKELYRQSLDLLSLTWTTEPPKVEGNYWWKCEQEQPDVPQMVNVTITDGKFHFFFHYSEGPCLHDCDECRWAGPIPEPQEPTP